MGCEYEGTLSGECMRGWSHVVRFLLPKNGAVVVDL